MNPVTVEFLTDIIDYAGLFPPAGLPMQAAVENYAVYWKGPYQRLLGRFVVPVARLDEFERAAKGILPDAGWEGNEFWRLSVLIGNDLSSDLRRIDIFNSQYARTDSMMGAALIDTIELKVETAVGIEAATRHLPERLTSYFEIPHDQPHEEWIDAIADNGARAKVRTGGLTPNAFPSSASLARFLVACANADVPFKATAGLHHPIRSLHRLTYEPDSPSGMMHGFLNVFIAAAFAQNGVDEAELIEILDETSPEAFHFDSGGITWRGHDAVRAHLRNTRNLFAMSFGSCSFEEPIADLKKLGLL